LKLCNKFIMNAAKKYVIKNLEDIYLPPARRLELAGKFGIPQWVKPAVKYILNHKLTELTAEDLALIGLGVYAILVKGKEFMDIEIRRTASRAPPMIQDPSWDCPDHKSYDTTWKRLWRKEIGWKLLHPTFPMKPDKILWTVQKFRDAGLYEKCRDDVIREIRKSSRPPRPLLHTTRSFRYVLSLNRNYMLIQNFHSDEVSLDSTSMAPSTTWINY
ncbi:hypothetical protein C8R44DRAFT_645559, partial [Mycena epipterygia]